MCCAWSSDLLLSSSIFQSDPPFKKNAAPHRFAVIFLAQSNPLSALHLADANCSNVVQIHSTEILTQRGGCACTQNISVAQKGGSGTARVAVLTVSPLERLTGVHQIVACWNLTSATDPHDVRPTSAKPIPFNLSPDPMATACVSSFHSEKTHCGRPEFSPPSCDIIHINLFFCRNTPSCDSF